MCHGKSTGEYIFCRKNFTVDFHINTATYLLCLSTDTWRYSMTAQDDGERMAAKDGGIRWRPKMTVQDGGVRWWNKMAAQGGSTR